MRALTSDRVSLGEGRRPPPISRRPWASWSMLPGIVRPRSRGHLRITGPGPFDPIEIVANCVVIGEKAAGFLNEKHAL